MKEDYQEALKKVTLFFLSNSVHFNRQNYQKQKGPGTSDQSLFRLRNKFRKIPLLVMYYLTKFDIKRFLSYSKNYICKFMQANSWHHKFFHFHLPFWIWKVWRARGKILKFEYLENEKSFLNKIKNIVFHSFIIFEGLSFDGKIKIWPKIADTSFKKLSRVRLESPA